VLDIGPGEFIALAVVAMIVLGPEKLPRYAAEAARFLAFMVTHGLSAGTIVATVRQLLAERTQDVGWRRALILDRLQFDVFKHYYRKLKPDFATFFLNSTAHFQHVYWRNMEPDKFKLKPRAAEQATRKDAVLAGYQSMDRIVGDVLEMAGDRAIVALVTALGQQPCTLYEDSGGKCFHKPRDFGALLRAVGIDTAGCHAEPVMSEEFHLRFTTEAAAAAALDRLQSATLDASPLFNASRDGTSIMAGCRVIREQPPGTRVRTVMGEWPFEDLFYFVDTVKSGMHHPEGLFWVRVPGHAPSRPSGVIPLTRVASMLLATMKEISWRADQPALVAGVSDDNAST